MHVGAKANHMEGCLGRSLGPFNAPIGKGFPTRSRMDQYQRKAATPILISRLIVVHNL